MTLTQKTNFDNFFGTLIFLAILTNNGEPYDLRRRTISLNKAYEVLILRHDDWPGISCLLEDLWIFSVTKAEIANIETFDSEGLLNPPRQSRGQLSIQPDDHAARIGLLTRWLAKRRQA